MAGTNNYQIWNPGSANQESDAAYASDSLRTGGAGTGAIFPSPTANKLFFQLSMMTYALAQMMANKNYNIIDNNAPNLVAALTNILTNADIPGNLVTPNDFACNLVANNGYIRFPTYAPFNGFKLLWGLSNAVAGDANSDSVNVSFAPAFTNCFAAFATAQAVSPGSHGGTVVHVTSLSASTMTITMVNADSNNHVGAVRAYWFAIGN
jgi:hypothetical protein